MTQAGTPAGEDGPPEVGSLAEEAARLMGALSGWAREHGDPGPHAGDPVAEAEDALLDGHDQGRSSAHGPTESDCALCPVCRTVHAVRSLSPEVRGHLASAATSLVHAAAGMLATALPDEGRARRPGAADDLQDGPA